MKSGAGDQATRIDVWLKGVAEIVSSALGGSRGCVCKVKVNFDINLYEYVTLRVYIFARAMRMYRPLLLQGSIKLFVVSKKHSFLIL